MARQFKELDRENLNLSGRQVGLQERQAGLQMQQVGLQERQVGLQERQAGLQMQQVGLQERQVGLQQEQLGLQQRQLQWQREMLLTNTIIQGTKVALGMTQAAVELGQIIGDYHNQQANLHIQTAAARYQAGVTEAITNGFDPYRVDTLENGQKIRRYIGYDNYKLEDGTTLGQIKDEAVKTVGEKYWTQGGAERGMQIAANAFENIELAAQRQTADAVIKNRQEVFNQELTNAVAVSQTTGDFTPVQQVIDGAPWMTGDEKQAAWLEAKRAAQYGNIQNTAISIANTRGIGEAQKYLDEAVLEIGDKKIPLSGDEKSEIFGEAQRTNNQGVEAARTDAAAAYTETQGTIRQKYNAAAGQNITNPDEREARRQTAQRKQFVDLEERFRREINGATLEQLEKLLPKYKEGGAYDADYYEQEPLQEQHYSEVSRLIEGMKADASRAESSTGNTLKNSINDTLDTMMSEWRAPDSGYDGRDILRFMIDNERDISPDKKLKYEKELLGDPASSAEYTRLVSLLESQRPDRNADALKKMDFAQKEYEIKKSLIDERLKGATGQRMREIINGIIEVESNDIVARSFEKGQLNTGGLIANTARTETELLHLMNQGKLDAYFGEITTGARYDRVRGSAVPETTPLVIGNDDKVNAVMAQINTRGKEFLNNELKAEGVTVNNGEMVKNAGGDKNGSLRYLGSDGNYYRVGVRGPAGPRLIEKWNNRGKKWEPYTPKRANGNPGYRPAAFPGDM
jgi:hypothetical protein